MYPETFERKTIWWNTELCSHFISSIWLSGNTSNICGLAYTLPLSIFITDIFWTSVYSISVMWSAVLWSSDVLWWVYSHTYWFVHFVRHCSVCLREFCAVNFAAAMSKVHKKATMFTSCCCFRNHSSFLLSVACSTKWNRCVQVVLLYIGSQINTLECIRSDLWH